MVLCVIRGCKSRSDVHSKLEHNLNFHRLPKKPELRAKWQKAINRSVIESTRICSKHFKQENYYTTKKGLKKLLPNAVPELNLVMNSSENEQFPPSQSKRSQQNNAERIQQTSSNEQIKVTSIEDLGLTIKPDSDMDTSEDEQFSPSDSIACQQAPSNNAEKIQQTGSNKQIIGTPMVVLGSTIEQDLDMDLSEEEQLSQSDPIEYPIPNEQIKVSTIKVSGSTLELNRQENNQENLVEIDPLTGKKQYKVTTPLEKKLMKEVKRLRLLSKSRMEVINCLEEQNRRLLKRNNFLQEALDARNTLNNTTLQDSEFFLTLT